MGVESRQRARKTVRFEAPVFLARLDEALGAERDGCRNGNAPRWAAQVLPTTRGLHASLAQTCEGATTARGHAWSAALGDALLALLKAFCDAAQPAGGLALSATLEPRDLGAILVQARLNAVAGECRPRLLAKVQQGRPVDVRIAVAALHFFRFVLERPGLLLVDIGGAETERLRSIQGIERALLSAREGLPAGVYDSLARRAAEVAAYAYVFDAMHVHYGDARALVDERGVMRVHLTSTRRYRPLRLHDFPGKLDPTITLEWYEWARVPWARLEVRVLSDDGSSVLRTQAFPVLKRPDPQRRFVRFEIDPAVPAADLEMLVVEPASVPGSCREVVWQCGLVLNAADRDIVVAYHPVAALSVQVDPALNDLAEVSVGDSPAVRSDPLVWTLGRALMPREVVAVRFRLRQMPQSAAQELSPSGEWSPGSGLG